MLEDLEQRGGSKSKRARNAAMEIPSTPPPPLRVVDATVRPGFDFLGYRFFGNSRYPRPSSEKKLRDSIREKTSRTSGEAMPEMIKRVNRSLRGWFEYFKNSSRQAFNAIDAYTRMRLRSVKAFEEARPGRWSRPLSLAKRLLSGTWPLQSCRGTCSVPPVREIGPLTGEPDAGDPPVRFGGRGGPSPGSPYPYRGMSLAA
jgi:hypothetical protein